MRPIRFGRRDIPGLLFVTLIIIGALYVAFKYPNWHAPSGFGPEWQCSPAGKGGPSLCIKKSTSDSR